MNLDLQFKIKNNPNYLRYLHENSYWYKILTRNPNSFREFEEKVKEAYHLRPMDRVSKALETVDMLQTLLSSFR